MKALFKIIINGLRNFTSKMETYFCPNKNYQFRIIEEIQSEEDKETIFLIQFVAKNIFPKLTASELARSDKILEKFCLSDIKRILHASYSNVNINSKVEFKIIAKNLAGNKVYTLASSVDPKFVKKLTPLEIISNKKLLLNLSKEDISTVCYDAGIENTFAELSLKNPQKTNVFSFKKISHKTF